MTIDIYPTLHLLPRPGLTPQALTVTRAGTATRMDPMGRVETVAADSLRHDYDPDTGVYLGWLIEEERTNLARHGRDLTQGVWTASGLTVARDAVGRDGLVNTASTLTATGAGATVLQAIPAASQPYTLSVDIRRESGTGGVLLTLDGGTTWIDVTSKLGARFTRVRATQTVPDPTVGLKLLTAGDAVAVDYWQVEAGAFATSRIATGAATVTRAPDLLTVDPADGWFNREEGTVYLEAVTPAATPTPKNLFSSEGTPDAVEMSVDDPADGVGANIGAIASGFFGGAIPSGIPYTPGDPLRVALTFGPDGGALVQDGTAFQQFSTGKSWDTGRFAIGAQLRNGPTRFLNGHVRHFAVFPRRLGVAQACALTGL